MDIQTKNKMLFWGMIFLILLNISTLVTFLVMSGPQEPVTCEAMHPRACMSLENELDLTPEQSRLIEGINSDYYTVSEPLALKIRSLRSAILDELSLAEPDTTVIRQNSQEIGQLQLQLQQANFNQFLRLKEVCDAGQAQRLSALYRELYGCSAMGGQKGKGEGLMHQSRYGRQ